MRKIIQVGWLFEDSGTLHWLGVGREWTKVVYQTVIKEFTILLSQLFYITLDLLFDIIISCLHLIIFTKILTPNSHPTS